jgi:hypothetical protein
LLQFVFKVMVVGPGDLVNQVFVALLQDFQQELFFVLTQLELHGMPPVNDPNRPLWRLGKRSFLSRLSLRRYVPLSVEAKTDLLPASALAK